MEREEFEELLERTVANLVQVRNESKNLLSVESYITFSGTIDRARVAIGSLQKAIKSKTTS